MSTPDVTGRPVDSPEQDSRLTQICILRLQVWTAGWAWWTEAPACHRRGGGVGCSLGSQFGFRRSCPDLPWTWRQKDNEMK